MTAICPGVRSHIVDKGECPSCGDRSVNADKLYPNKDLRSAVEAFKNKGVEEAMQAQALALAAASAGACLWHRRAWVACYLYLSYSTFEKMRTNALVAFRRLNGWGVAPPAACDASVPSHAQAIVCRN